MYNYTMIKTIISVIGLFISIEAMRTVINKNFQGFDSKYYISGIFVLIVVLCLVLFKENAIELLCLRRPVFDFRPDRVFYRPFGRFGRREILYKDVSSASVDRVYGRGGGVFVVMETRSKGTFRVRADDLDTEAPLVTGRLLGEILE